ncbi:acyl-CoA N-acyltransferase, partial [Sporormia fimetaria CBS 119925]
MVIVDPKYTTKTERLLLRPLRLDDAPAVNVMRAHPEVMLHTPMLPCDDISKTLAWIQGCHDRPNNWNFAIELLPSEGTPDLSDSSRVIGLVGAVRAPEVGYMLNFDYWGKGYATEALRGFLPLFFEYYSGGEREEQERFEYAEAQVDPVLRTSRRVLEKAGFQKYEFKPDNFENPVLGLRDTVVYRRYR